MDFFQTFQIVEVIGLLNSRIINFALLIMSIFCFHKSKIVIRKPIIKYAIIYVTGFFIPSLIFLISFFQILSQNGFVLFIVSSITYSILFSIYFNFHNVSNQFQICILFYFITSGFISITYFKIYLNRSKYIHKLISIFLKFFLIIFISYQLSFFSFQSIHKMVFIILNLIIDLGKHKIRPFKNTISEQFLKSQKKSVQFRRLITINEFNEQSIQLTELELTKLRESVSKYDNVKLIKTLSNLKKPKKFLKFLNEGSHLNNDD